MKNQTVIWLGLMLVLPILMAACGGTTTLIPETEASTVTATENPATEQPATEQPATEQPATEQPATEQPATEQPATAEPTITGPHTANIAPDFTLPDSNGNMVHLADELNDNRMVILIFYHAYN